MPHSALKNSHLLLLPVGLFYHNSAALLSFTKRNLSTQCA